MFNQATLGEGEEPRKPDERIVMKWDTFPVQ